MEFSFWWSLFWASTTEVPVCVWQRVTKNVHSLAGNVWGVQDSLTLLCMCLCVWTVLSFGDTGDRHSGRNRHWLDHPKQDLHHTWSGRRRVSLGSAADHAGELSTHLRRKVSAPAVPHVVLPSCGCRREFTGCCWWITTLPASHSSSSLASCASASCMFMVSHLPQLPDLHLLACGQSCSVQCVLLLQATETTLRMWRWCWAFLHQRSLGSVGGSSLRLLSRWATTEKGMKWDLVVNWMEVKNKTSNVLCQMNEY